MAKNLQITYPGKTITGDPLFPYGKPKNVNVNGDGTGTPFEAEWASDIAGFFQHLLVNSDTVPSNLPDNVQISQYMEAIKTITFKEGERVFEDENELLITKVNEGDIISLKSRYNVKMQIMPSSFTPLVGDITLEDGKVATMLLQAVNDVRWWGAVPDFEIGATRSEDTGTDNTQAIRDAINRLASVGHPSGVSAFDVDEKVLSFGGCKYGISDSIYITGDKHGIKFIDGFIAPLTNWGQGFSDKALFSVGEAGNQAWLFNFNNITFNARKRTNGILFTGTQKNGALYCNASEFIDFGFSTLNTNGELKLTNCSSYEYPYQEGLTIPYTSTTGSGFWMRSADFLLDGCVGAVSKYGLRITGGYNYQVVGCHFWLGLHTDSPLGNVPAIFVDEDSHSGVFTNLYIDHGIVELRGSFDHLFDDILVVGDSSGLFKLVATVADEDAAGLVISNVRTPKTMSDTGIAYIAEVGGTWKDFKKHLISSFASTDGNSFSHNIPNPKMFLNKEGGLFTNTSDVSTRDITVADMNPSIHTTGTTFRRMSAVSSFSTYKGFYPGFFTAMCPSGDTSDYSAQPTSGDFIGQFWSTASNGSSFGTAAKPFHGGGGLRLRASEDWNTTDQGVGIRLYGTVQGTSTPVPFLYLDESSVTSRADNTVTLGSGSNRWSEVFSVNGTINTSDERSKEQIEDIPDVVLDAWSNVEKRRYKWVESVTVKGDAARWHIGVIAQDIQRAFEAEGLDASEWAVLCFDSWEEQVIEYPATYAPKEGTTGEEDLIMTAPAYTEVIPAGERYGVRYDQAAQLDAALERREHLKLEAKVLELTELLK
ncbi:hypothetical protein DRO66_08710 [Candidatus Bathyarchaeota archaeon]|nr:MAG: hypothetical protein DRO66_08710 [Candidatus Bathyarchaeota archaeon]